MRNEGLAKTLIAGAAIAAHRIVKFGASDTAALQAAAATDLLVGVSDLGAASGDPVDVIIDGIALVEYGGNVTRGDLLTADADGKAVKASPDAATTVRVIGTAMLSGVAGDIGSVAIGRGTATTARNESITRTLTAGAAIAAKRIVKFGATDTAAIQAAAATDLLLGVSSAAADSAAAVTVVLDGVAPVEYGGNVTRGEWLTADADGKAVAAAPAATATAQCIGRAMVSGVSGDIGSVRIAPAAVTNGANS